ncbi:MAG: GNAT family N-acetyltransferase [Candidatus Latescibacteria bacterium]|nr:GNAT family N-acetyltransferase [Candidatus Latescibacterota bacterium]
MTVALQNAPMIEEIEAASLKAWPDLDHVEDDGWVLRFANGYTKRANSVNVLRGSKGNIDEKIARCETAYADRGQPAIFRITPLSMVDQLDDRLSILGYRRIDTSLVQYRSCSDPNIDPLLQTIHSIFLSDWLQAYIACSQEQTADHATHMRILEAIDSPRITGGLKAGTATVACGLGVVNGDYLGLFGLITAFAHRRKGYGMTLVASMLKWGRSQGASRAYLQVVEENAAALSLYDRLAFQTLYRYWYRVPRNWPDI